MKYLVAQLHDNDDGESSCGVLDETARTIRLGWRNLVYISNAESSDEIDVESGGDDDDDNSGGEESIETRSNFNFISFDTYPDFGPENKSLTAKYLTRELFDQLKDKKSSKGYTLSNSIQDAVVHQHLNVGTTAGDEECWEIFKELYYPIIYSLHGYDAYNQKHDAALVDMDPSKLK